MQLQRNSTYGHLETPNQLADLGINGHEYHSRKREVVLWTHPGLKIARMRMLTDSYCPVWDVTYCYGVLKDGTEVEVDLPFSQLRRYKWKADIIEAAKRDGVYAKALGIFDAVSMLA